MRSSVSGARLIFWCLFKSVLRSRPSLPTYLTPPSSHLPHTWRLIEENESADDEDED